MEKTRQLRQTPMRLVLRLAISGLAPLVLYGLLRPLVNNDAAALALVGAISAVTTILLSIWRRRVDWIGVLAILGFVAASLLTILSGGSALPLELRGSVVAGVIGAAFLISVVINRPLLLLLTRLLRRGDPQLTSALDERLNDPASRSRLTFLSAVIGFGLLGKALADLLLALSLPTASFLATSRLVNWTILGGGAILLWWLTHRPSQPHPPNDASNV